MTKNQILSRLEKIKIPQGRPITVHCSLKSIGNIRAEDLLDCLIEHFTKDGGLLTVPTHTWDSDVYDRRTNKTCIGVLPTVAAAHPDGIRTLHPTHSMAVFGDEKAAKAFASADDDTDTPASPHGCYGRLFDLKGYVLLIGVGQDKNTYIHCVEEMLGVCQRLTKDKVERTIIHKDGREQKRYLYWFDESEIPDVSVNFTKFEAAFRYHNCIRDFKLANADVMLCDAVAIKKVIELIYKRSGGIELLADKTPLDESLYK